MPWIFSYDGHDVDIEDLPLTVYAEIQKTTGVAWYEVGSQPMKDPGAAIMLADACADAAGVELPTLTPKLLVSLFAFRADENRPEQYVDGVPDPKAQG